MGYFNELLNDNPIPLGLLRFKKGKMNGVVKTATLRGIGIIVLFLDKIVSLDWVMRLIE